MLRTICITLLLVASVPAGAASCRAGTAAQTGSESGYERARAAAEAWSQRQNNVSASLGDCLGNISTTITAPTFPNLTEVMNQIGQKICKAARDKISDYVPPTLDPWGDLPGVSGVASYGAAVQTVAEPAAPATSVGDRLRAFISLN